MGAGLCKITSSSARDDLPRRRAEVPGREPAPAAGPCRRDLCAIAQSPVSCGPDHRLTQMPPSPTPALGARYLSVRRHSLDLAAPLSAEDQCVQAMPDASPTKWHLAHTTWFFETLVLGPHAPGYRPHDERYARLFNSY